MFVHKSEKRKPLRKCIMGCTDFTHTYRAKNEEMRLAWQQALGPPKLLRFQNVCNRHFSLSNFKSYSEQYHLTNGAVPDLFLEKVAGEEESPKNGNNSNNSQFEASDNDTYAISDDETSNEDNGSRLSEQLAVKKNGSSCKNAENTPDSSLEHALERIEGLLNEDEFRDEHSIYGEHIANMLRTCNRSSEDIATAQYKIENIVFNLIMGAYEQGAQVGNLKD